MFYRLIVGLIGALSTLTIVPAITATEVTNPENAQSTRKILTEYEYFPATLVISNVGCFDGPDCDDENANVERGLVVLLNTALAGPHCSNKSGFISHNWSQSQEIEHHFQSVGEGAADFDLTVEVC
jgi:hypothetical protein